MNDPHVLADPTVTQIPPKRNDLRAGNVMEQAIDHGWDKVLGALAPELHVALSNYGGPVPHVACPVHGSPTGSNDGFRMFRDAATSGGGICNTCGVFPTGVYLLAWILRARDEKWQEQGRTPAGYNPKNDMEYRKRAWSMVADYLEAGVVSHPALTTPIPRVKAQETTQEKRLRMMRTRNLGESLWSSSQANDPRVERYFSGRWGKDNADLVPETTDHMRIIERAPYFSGLNVSYHTALMLPVLGLRGFEQVIGLHRIYLQERYEQGKLIVEKANLPSPKKILRWDNLRGLHIQLFPLLGSILIVCEGVETAIALRALTGLPVWSCVNAWGLENFEPPQGLQTLIIAGDHDWSQKGAKASLALHDRLKAQGFSGQLKVKIPDMFPIKPQEKTVDWEDALIRHRSAAFQQWSEFSHVLMPV